MSVHLGPDQAKAYVQQLRDNVALWYANQVTFEEFTARQGELWTTIRESGRKTEDLVLAILRNDPEVV